MSKQQSLALPAGASGDFQISVSSLADVHEMPEGWQCIYKRQNKKRRKFTCGPIDETRWMSIKKIYLLNSCNLNNRAVMNKLCGLNSKTNLVREDKMYPLEWVRDELRT